MDETVLDHELVPNAGAGGMKDDPLVAGEGLDHGVLVEVGFGPILNVVVEGEDRLRRISHVLRTDGSELGKHRAGVVVGHDVRRAHRHHVTREDLSTLFESHRVRLDYFLCDRLCHLLLPLFSRLSRRGPGAWLPICANAQMRAWHPSHRVSEIGSFIVLPVRSQTPFHGEKRARHRR